MIFDYLQNGAKYGE